MAVRHVGTNGQMHLSASRANKPALTKQDTQHGDHQRYEHEDMPREREADNEDGRSQGQQDQRNFQSQFWQPAICPKAGFVVRPVERGLSLFSSTRFIQISYAHFPPRVNLETPRLGESAPLLKLLTYGRGDGARGDARSRSPSQAGSPSSERSAEI